MARADRRSGRRHAATALWFVAVGLGTLALALGWSALAVPGWIPTAGAVAVTTAYAFALSVRTGGRAVLTGALALVLSLGAVLSELPVLLAGAAVSTAAISGVLGVIATKPAPRFVGVVGECLVAAGVGAVGALAVEAYQAEVSLKRLGYLALGLALLSTIGLVYRLGAGLHGLGRRGAVMVLIGLGVLLVTLAYTEALSTWGSPGFVEAVADTRAEVKDSVGAVPRPIQVLLGFPALAWGVSSRARRRQGWWVCAFGAAAVTSVSVSLLDPGTSLVEAGLQLVYGVALGLVLGYLVIRLDTFLTGARGRRARRLEEASAHRPEPGRLQPLL